MKILSKDLAK
jgi:hypothetical protein